MPSGGGVRLSKLVVTSVAEGFEQTVQRVRAVDDSMDSAKGSASSLARAYADMERANDGASGATRRLEERLNPALKLTRDYAYAERMLAAEVIKGNRSKEEAVATLEKLRAAQAEAAESSHALGRSSGSTRMAMMEFGHSGRAVADGLIAGISPMRVMAMEAPRIGQALAEMGIPLARLAMVGAPFAAVAASVGVVTYQTEAYQGRLNKLQATLDLTGRTLGMTKGELLDLADATAKASNLSSAHATGVVQAIVGSGKAGPLSIRPEAMLAADYGAHYDLDEEKGAAKIASDFSDPIKGLALLKDEFQIGGAALTTYVARMHEMGDNDAATAAEVNALSITLRGLRERELSPGMAALDNTTLAVGRFIESLRLPGAETAEQKLRSLKAELEAFQKNPQAARQYPARGADLERQVADAQRDVDAAHKAARDAATKLRAQLAVDDPTALAGSYDPALKKATELEKLNQEIIADLKNMKTAGYDVGPAYDSMVAHAAAIARAADPKNQITPEQLQLMQLQAQLKGLRAPAALRSTAGALAASDVQLRADIANPEILDPNAANALRRQIIGQQQSNIVGDAAGATQRQINALAAYNRAIATGGYGAADKTQWQAAGIDAAAMGKGSSVLAEAQARAMALQQGYKTANDSVQDLTRSLMIMRLADLNTVAGQQAYARERQAAAMFDRQIADARTADDQEGLANLQRQRAAWIAGQKEMDDRQRLGGVAVENVAAQDQLKLIQDRIALTDRLNSQNLQIAEQAAAQLAMEEKKLQLQREGLDITNAEVAAQIKLAGDTAAANVALQRMHKDQTDEQKAFDDSRSNLTNLFDQLNSGDSKGFKAFFDAEKKTLMHDLTSVPLTDALMGKQGQGTGFIGDLLGKLGIPGLGGGPSSTENMNVQAGAVYVNGAGGATGSAGTGVTGALGGIFGFGDSQASLSDLTSSTPWWGGGFSPAGLATGIADVPYDNMPAYLHAGETVFPATYGGMIRDMHDSYVGGGASLGGDVHHHTHVHFNGPVGQMDHATVKKIAEEVSERVSEKVSLAHAPVIRKAAVADVAAQVGRGGSYAKMVGRRR